MTEERKPGLGFGADRAVALRAPVEATEHHEPHQLDSLVIEMDEENDTALIYLSEVDTASGHIPITRASMHFPISMLADLIRRRPMTATEQEEFAKAEEENAAAEEAQIAREEAEAKILK